MYNKIKVAVRFMAVLALLAFARDFSVSPVSAQEKMKPEDVITKHLEAVGSADARAMSRSRIVSGSSLMSLRTGGRGQADGPALIASKNDSFLINASFESPEYPFEKISYDGSKLVVEQFGPGARSPIGEFFLTYEEIFKEGLIGGALSSAWSLLDVETRKAKIKYDGTDKVDGKNVYKLKYQPRKSSDLKIKLYFDAENFRHIRTEYERTIAAQMGDRPMSSGAQRETRYKVTENFSDFIPVGGLTIPKKYSIEYSRFSGNTPVEIDWEFSFSKFEFNQPVNIEEFRSKKK